MKLPSRGGNPHRENVLIGERTMVELDRLNDEIKAARARLEEMRGYL
jgi:hypothetical protein